MMFPNRLTVHPGTHASARATVIGALLALLLCIPALVQAQPNWNTIPTGNDTWADNYLNFLVTDPNVPGPQPFYPHIGDPSILVLTDEHGPIFYLTGTSGDYNSLTFPIYKSRNLRYWALHMLAFNPGTTYTTINGRKFTRLWSPQLYVRPNDSNYVYLAFACNEEVPIPDSSGTTINPGLPAASQPCDPFYDGEDLQYISAMACAMTKSAFMSASHRFAGSPDPWDNNQPAYYHYRKNNAGSQLYYDGGEAQGRYAIPVTGTMYAFGPNCGQAERLVWGFQHRCHGGEAWIADGPFVFFDPANSNQPWLFFSWMAFTNPTQNTVNGNHIYAHQMWDGISQMHATGAGFHVAYRSSDLNKPITGNPLPNGMSNLYRQQYTRCHQGQNYAGGVAESPSVFYRTSVVNGQLKRWYYVFYSRNTWDSPDYQILYRRSNGTSTTIQNHHSTGGLGINWAESSAPEKVLVRSFEDSFSQFGNGEVFQGLGRVYLLCHSRVWINNNDGRGYRWTRSPYFKELAFQANGDILQLYEYDSNWSRSMHKFRVKGF